MGGFHIEPGVSSIAIRQVLFRAPRFCETILYRQVLKFAKWKCQEYWFCAGLDKTKEIRRSANYHGRTIELCSSLTEARALPFRVVPYLFSPPFWKIYSITCQGLTSIYGPKSLLIPKHLLYIRNFSSFKQQSKLWAVISLCPDTSTQPMSNAYKFLMH